MSEINIYTDGSSRGNPGPGGYGVILKYGRAVKELSAGFRRTTNNRMELMAVIVGLESLKTQSIPVKIHSDSKYVLDAITKGWVHGWHRKDFAGKKNKDLWLRFLQAQRGFNISYFWVRGHNGHPENERCDELAVAAALNKPMHLIDAGYETEEARML
jgi:ribonuclease HI